MKQLPEQTSEPHGQRESKRDGGQPMTGKYSPKEKLDRHRAFWHRQPVDRPLLMVQFGVDVLSFNWCPVYGLHSYTNTQLRPEMVLPADHAELYLLSLVTNRNILDDSLPVVSALSSIPWMEAFIGCDLVVRDGRVWAEYSGETPPNIDRLYRCLNDTNPWLGKYAEFMELFRKEFSEYPVGQPLLRGPTDLAGILCGSTDAVLNLYDEPEYMHRLLQFCCDAYIWAAGKILDATPPCESGYCLGTFSLWAPGRCARFQEDFASLYSPELFRTFVLDLDRQIASTFPFSLFHLHTSQLKLIDEIVSNPSLGAVQITRDINVRDIRELIEASQRVQRSDKALVLRGAFAETEMDMLRQELSAAGLFIQHITRIDELNAAAESMARGWNGPRRVASS
jgi:hypothetical protein